MKLAISLKMIIAGSTFFAVVTPSNSLAVSDVGSENSVTVLTLREKLKNDSNLIKGSLSEKDSSLIKKYLNSLFPSRFQSHYIKSFHESVSILLKPVSKYVAVLNACETNDNVTWKLLNEDSNVLDIIEHETMKTDSALEFDSQDSNDYICESFHSLADQLPAFGTYKLDILLGSDVLRELSVRKEPSLAGAFIRLTRWHSADFTIFEQHEFDADRLNEWLEIMNGKILHSDRKCELGPCLWRGSIQFSSFDNKKEMYNGFQLKLDADGNEDSSSSAVKQNPYRQHLEHFVISSKLELVKEVSFGSIPPYLLTPVTFRLCFSKLHLLNENSPKLIEYLLSSKTVVIAKLCYSVLKERSKPERKYSSRAWEKAASSGDVKDSDCFVSSFEKFITFAITKSCFSNHVVAYPLRDSAYIDASFFYTLLNHRISNAHSFVPEEKSKTEPEASLDSNSKHKNVLHKYKCCTNSRNGHCKDIDFSFVTENDQNLPSCSQFDERNSLKFSVEQLDPSDWPERIQLLQKQMRNEEEKDGFSTNASVVHNLKLPHQSYSLSTQTITDHFLSSGERKNSENCENINLNSNSHYLVNHSLDDILQMKWPEVMNCIYHDLYYNNSDQMEDKENIGSQLVNLYVQHETACTCNNRQMIQNFQITVSERIQSPSKAFRGPSARLAIISNDNRETSPSPRKNNLRELITKKILSTSTLQVKNSDETKRTFKERSKINSEERRKSLKETSKRNSANKNLVPVRCSPRKKTPVSYKDSSLNRNNENKNAESNKMPDLLKKKLRCAVAKALEDNGISGTHKLYQPCGAKLLTICRTFVDDLKLKKGKTSEYLQKIADAHVKQVIEFYKDS